MKNIYPAEQEYQTGAMDQNAVLKLLREKGYRITKQRENLLHIIMEGNCSSCKEIYFEAVKKNLKIGMATIYRMMNLLEEIGALKLQNRYGVQKEDGQPLEVCQVEMEDTTKMELSGKTICEIFEKGLEVCGYSGGKKVKEIVIGKSEKISQ